MIKTWPLIASLVSISFILRLIYAIFSHDFWMDESLTLSLAQNSFFSVFQALSYDNWPPLYTIFLHFWQQVSTNLIWIRLLSVIFGTVSVFLIYQIGKILFNKRVAFISLVIASVSPPLVYFSSENRAYSLFVMLSLLTILTYFKLSKAFNLKHFFFFIISASLTLYTHYFAVLLLISLPLASFISSFSRINFKQLFLAFGSIFLIFSPWLAFTIGKEKPFCLCLQPILGIAASIAFLSINGGGFITLKSFLENAPLAIKIFLVFYLLLTTIVFFLSTRFLKIPQVRFLTVLFFLPLLIIFIVSFIKPFFSVRSFIFLVPVFILLTAYAINQIRVKFNNLILWGYTILSVAILLITTQQPFFNQEPLWQMSQTLAGLSNQENQIIHANLYTYLPSRYYYPNHHHYVFKQNLPEGFYQTIKPNFFKNPNKKANQIIFVYAIDRLENILLADFLQPLSLNYNLVRENKLGKIRIVFFTKKEIRY